MTNVEGIITEDIKDTITTDLTIYDNAGSKVGKTTYINRQSGYMTVEMEPFSDKERPLEQKKLYIPFRLITTIDPRELTLSMSRDELEKQFADPPPRTIVVEGPPGLETAVTSEPSGYDGTPLVVGRVQLGQLRKRITTGYHIYTSDHVDVGVIQQYDSLTGWMLAKDPLDPDEPGLMVPLSTVAAVDDVTREVHTVTSQADLKRMTHLEPANVVFTEKQKAEAR